ncbi:MAG: TlpA family protein disulfide reductase [Saprospiraceae bacterium]|nr:TlpA family protein disulfide reductase [Saprospiraceae bacterium]
MKYFVLGLLCFICLPNMQAAINGAHLKIQIENYEGKEVYLVKYVGDQAYIKDTLLAEVGGQFVYQSEEKLKSGIYYIVIPPKNEFVEILLTEEEQHYSLQMDHTRLTKDREFTNAPQNSLLQDYRLFMEDRSAIHRSIVGAPQEGEEKSPLDEVQQEQLQALRAEVKTFQKELIEKQPQSLAATIIKTQIEPDFPEFKGSEAERQQQKFWYTKAHFFDPFTKDARLYSSNLFFQKVEQYFERYTAIQPDSISHSIDQVLGMLTSDEEAFRFYYLKFLNEYLQSNYVGMDAVVVHLVNEYMKKGKADFIAADKRKELIGKVSRWETLLIGKIAPAFRSYHLDVEGTLLHKNEEDPNKRFKLSGLLDLHSFKSPYTLVVFWSPTCGHCKKTMPELVKFHKEYQAKGLEVIAVCDKETEDYPSCAQAIKDWDAIHWINTVDPSNNYRFLFYVDETPKMFLLDHKKEILLKGNLKLDSLGPIMDDFIEKDKEGKK